jgi:hypothetical protein
MERETRAVRYLDIHNIDKELVEGMQRMGRNNIVSVEHELRRKALERSGVKRCKIPPGHQHRLRSHTQYEQEPDALGRGRGCKWVRHLTNSRQVGRRIRSDRLLSLSIVGRCIRRPGQTRVLVKCRRLYFDRRYTCNHIN